MKFLLNPEADIWQKELARPVQKTKAINKIVKPILKLRKFGRGDLYFHIPLIPIKL